MRQIATGFLTLLVSAVTVGSVAGCGGPAPPSRYSVAPVGPASLPTPYVSGLLTTNPLSSVTPSGANVANPGIYDSQGRSILLHGVNAVYKRPPYELYVAPGKPWNFDAKDAAQMAALGLNIVRLGIIWQGIEPGTLRPNDPRVCTKGTPGDPGQWNQDVANRYIQRVAQTVDLLGQYHIYSMLDMHQDVYNQAFRGEGAPAWAVCTDGRPLKALPGRWSNNYANKALDAAFDNFWTNDVVGNLQGEYDRSWAAVASALASNPWVVGYDPINEPFTTSVLHAPVTPIADQLECFYTGKDHPGYEESDTPLVFFGKPIQCGPNIPALGVIPSIQAADPHRMIFIEPTIYEYRKTSNLIGPMPFSNLVLNFHAYCGARSPVTGNPYNEVSCFTEVERRFLNRSVQVVSNPSPSQANGLPLFLSEFGATQSAAHVAEATGASNLLNVGWAYWSWKYYNDPTGSSSEAVASSDNQLYSQAAALDQSYPQAVSGTILTYLYIPDNGDFFLTYESDPLVTAPTLVFISSRVRSRGGYCVNIHGGKVVSGANAPMLEVQNLPTADKVMISVTPGKCT